MAEPVWLMVMYDLPTRTKQQRRNAQVYREMILNEGFDMVQLSVYVKYIPNATGARPVYMALKNTVPADGLVRMIRLSDEQWAQQHRFFGLKTLKVEEKPDVLDIFETWESSISQ